MIEVEKRDLEKRLEAATQKQLQNGGVAIRDDKNNNVAMSAYNSLTLPNKFNKQLSVSEKFRSHSFVKSNFRTMKNLVRHLYIYIYIYIYFTFYVNLTVIVWK